MMNDIEHADSDTQPEDTVEIFDLDSQDVITNNLLRHKVSQLLQNPSPAAISRSRWMFYAVVIGLIVLVVVIQANPSSPSEQTPPVSIPATPSPQFSVTNVSATNGIAYIDAPDGTLSAHTATNGAVLWQRKFVSPTYLLVTATSTTLYGISYSPAGSFVEALRASDGRFLWNYPAPPPGSAAIIVKDGIVYYNAQDGTVYALRASDGTELWHYTSGVYAPLDTFLYAADGVACIHAQDGTVHIIRAKDGTEILRYQVQTGWNWWPHAENGIIYISTGRGSIQVNSTIDGHFLWRATSQENSSWFWSEAEGIVYTYTQSTLQALRGTDGATLWQYPTKSGLAAPPVVEHGIAYLTLQDGTVSALRTNNGSLLWYHKMSLSVLYGPVVANGILYLGLDDHTIYAWKGSDGSYLWQYSLASPIIWYPQIDNGMMYLLQLNGGLDILRISDGTVLWHYATTTAGVSEK